MNTKRSVFAAVTALSLVFCSISLCATEIRDVVLDPMYVDWYEGSSSVFHMSSPMAGYDDQAILIGGLFDTIPGGNPEYILEIDTDMGQFGFIDTGEIALFDDVTPTGGKAKAYFGPSGTISIYGTLIKFAGGALVADGTSTPLIEAQISSTEWYMVEEDDNYVTARIDFNVTGGLLSNPLWNSDELIMPDFWSLFTFHDVDPDVIDFENFGGIYSSVNVDIQIGAVPEPTTIALLGLGGLVLRRRKRNN
ncbi:MAG: PEP-CTERM sorting domain-containing protein [Sedimentisphaerales bacterium]|nr:PEP-CTERM sorting domain-containing protein [Sedimentisphaerales bacterium]